MAQISYGVFKELISYVQSGEEGIKEASKILRENGLEDEALLSALVEINEYGKKNVTSLDKIFVEEQELSSDKVMEYSRRINKFIKNHNFAPPLLVKEFPEERIEDFSQSVWASITKSKAFKTADYEGKKILLTLGMVYGVFENDDDSHNRLNALMNMLQDKSIEELEVFNGMEMKFDYQFYNFIKDNQRNLEGLGLLEIQDAWEKISRCVDQKTLENVGRYMQVYAENEKNEFEAYMDYHNVSEYKREKYKVIYEQMLGRTEMSTPTVKGKSDKGYSYEILELDDINVMRFGDKLKCCQKLGSNAHTSMVNSAIEATSRVMIVKNEKGVPIAGSLITHKISEEGRSYLCFDSIEVRAAKLPVKAKAYSKTLKRIDKLVKKGVIPSAEISDIEAYVERNPDSKDITLKDIEALKINKKIRETYQVAIEDIKKADEENRRKQLEQGEITEQECNRLLIKNGLITVGRNPVSMYLGDLPKVDKKDREMLPALRKDLSIYRKSTPLLSEDNLKKIVRPMSKTAIALGALTVATLPITGPTIPMVAMGASFLGLGAYGTHKIKNGKVNHTYTDAFEQRVLYDGRENVRKQEIDKNQIQTLKSKFLYRAYDVKLTRVAEMTEEQRKQMRRLREAVGKQDFTEQEHDKYVVGNGKNWFATLSRDGEKITVKEVAMLNSFGFSEKLERLADAQVEMMQTFKEIAGRADEIVYDTGDPKIDKYLSRNVIGNDERNSHNRNKDKGIDMDK